MGIRTGCWQYMAPDLDDDSCNKSSREGVLISGKHVWQVNKHTEHAELQSKLGGFMSIKTKLFKGPKSMRSSDEARPMPHKVSLLQDEEHAVFLCSCASVCSLRKTYAQLFPDFTSQRIFLDEPGAFFYSQASSEDLGKLSRLSSQTTWLKKQTNDTYRSISDIMDIFCAVGTVE
eukprot:1156104-Pelagomonas_calceolata.AAC.3